MMGRKASAGNLGLWGWQLLGWRDSRFGCLFAGGRILRLSVFYFSLVYIDLSGCAALNGWKSGKWRSFDISVYFQRQMDSLNVIKYQASLPGVAGAA